jgi:hypothetical protein
MASARCCRRFLGQCSFSTDGYIYMGHLLGHSGSVGRMQRACLFTWPAVTLKKNVEECMYVEASCDNLKKSRNLHSFFLSFFLSRFLDNLLGQISATLERIFSSYAQSSE